MLTAIKNVFNTMIKPKLSECSTLFFEILQKVFQIQPNLSKQKKATFLSYQKPFFNKQKNNLNRFIIQNKTDNIVRLKDQLAKNQSPELDYILIEKLIYTQNWDSITETLKKRKASTYLYIYAAQKAFPLYGYRVALRLLKEALKPNAYQFLVERLVQEKNFDTLEKAIEEIGHYILYYHRLTVSDASTYKQYAYAYAALAAARKKWYKEALFYAEKTGRLTFIWVDLSIIAAKNQDFFEVDNFAKNAKHLQEDAYTAALKYCQEDSPWYLTLEQKTYKHSIEISAP